MSKTDFWKKLGITMGALLLVRIVAHIPVPGVQIDMYKMAITQYTNTAFSLMNQFTGGALSNMTLLGIGISPYISASIIVELLCVISNRLGDLSREGYYGHKRIERMNVMFGICSSVVVSSAAGLGLWKLGFLQKSTLLYALLAAGSLCVGAIFLIGMGKLIDKKGIGNGISLILFVNIVSTFPQDIGTVMTSKKYIAILAVVITAVILGIVLFMELTKKEIKVLGSKYLEDVPQAKGLSNIPIKLAICGVMPIIFVSSFQQMGGLIKAFELNKGILRPICQLLSSDAWFVSRSPYAIAGIVLYLLTLTGCTFLYADIVFNPVNAAIALKEKGSFIPNVRPGNETVAFLRKERRSMVIADAVLLSIISVTPIFLSNMWSLKLLQLSGTSIVIAVGVLIETSREIKAEFSGVLYDKKNWF